MKIVLLLLLLALTINSNSALKLSKEDNDFCFNLSNDVFKSFKEHFESLAPKVQNSALVEESPTKKLRTSSKGDGPGDKETINSTNSGWSYAKLFGKGAIGSALAFSGSALCIDTSSYMKIITLMTPSDGILNSRPIIFSKVAFVSGMYMMAKSVFDAVDLYKGNPKNQPVNQVCLKKETFYEKIIGNLQSTFAYQALNVLTGKENDHINKTFNPLLLASASWLYLSTKSLIDIQKKEIKYIFKGHSKSLIVPLWLALESAWAASCRDYLSNESKE